MSLFFSVGEYKNDALPDTIICAAVERKRRKGRFFFQKAPFLLFGYCGRALSLCLSLLSTFPQEEAKGEKKRTHSANALRSMSRPLRVSRPFYALVPIKEQSGTRQEKRAAFVSELFCKCASQQRRRPRDVAVAQYSLPAARGSRKSTQRLATYDNK